jgi:hypothetical protein
MRGNLSLGYMIFALFIVPFQYYFKSLAAIISVLHLICCCTTSFLKNDIDTQLSMQHLQFNIEADFTRVFLTLAAAYFIRKYLTEVFLFRTNLKNAHDNLTTVLENMDESVICLEEALSDVKLEDLQTDADENITYGSFGPTSFNLKYCNSKADDFFGTNFNLTHDLKKGEKQVL